MVTDAVVVAILIGDDGADGDPIARADNLERDVLRPTSAQLLLADDLGSVPGGFRDLNAPVVPIDAQPLAGGDALGPGEACALAPLELLGGERRDENARGEERRCESDRH